MAQMVVTLTEAAGVVLLVSGGAHGDGFSVHCQGIELLRQLPTVLRDLAADIEEDLKRIGN
jgi:hypothetical protein